MSSFIPNYFKTKVSKNRKRHKEFGLDLDLTYITDRIIAMAFPAERMESIYRNRLNDVYEFFEKKHKDHYYIYNLCSERSYDKAKFYNRVKVYPFEDHNPPSFPVIGSFCRDVDKCLQDDPENVVAIHCKAGKGRTGTMICCYLLHCGKFATAEEAIEFYGKVRTEDGRGVTIPSQIRYVKYYEQYLREGETYYPTTIYIKRVHLRPPPKFSEPAVLTVKEKIFESPPRNAAEQHLQDMAEENRRANGELVDYEGKYPFMEDGCKTNSSPVKQTEPEYVIDYPSSRSNSGDIRFELFYRSPVFTKKKRLARVWINSYFAEKNGLPCAVGNRYRDLIFKKEELDIAWKKDRKHRQFPADFEMKIHIEVPPSPPTARNRAQHDGGGAASEPEPPRQRRRSDDSSGAEDDTEEENDWESGKCPTMMTHDVGGVETVNDGASTSTGAANQIASPAVNALRHDALLRQCSSSASDSSTSQNTTVKTAYQLMLDALSSASSLETPIGGASAASTAIAGPSRSTDDLDAVTTAPESDNEDNEAARGRVTHNFPCVDAGPRPCNLDEICSTPLKVFGLIPLKKRRRFVVYS